MACVYAHLITFYFFFYDFMSKKSLSWGYKIS